MKFKIFKNLIVTILLISLIFPKLVFAGFFDDVVNYLDHLTESIEEPVVGEWSSLIRFTLFYLFGLGALAISIYIFNVAVYNQPAWLIQLEPATQAGLNFILGLCNMFLILFFVFVALATILKIETYETKKTLVKLIIVALLINFSPLFVKMIFDLSQIIYNSILKAGGENLFSTLTETIFKAGGKPFQKIFWIIGALTISLITPFVHPIAQIGFAIAYTTYFIPLFIQWAFQALSFYILAIMFLLFSLLFGIRVVIIQILIILSPLAFLSLALPSLKQWWDKWLKILIEWIFLGIFFLFFLILGFKTLGYLEIPPAYNITSIFSRYILINWKQLLSSLFYYFVMSIYLIAILGVGWATKPSAAEGIINALSGVGKIMWGRVIRPAGRRFIESTQSGLVEMKKIEEKRRAEAEARGQPIPTSRFEKIRHRVYGWAEREVKTRISEREKKLETYSDEELRDLASRKIVDATTTAAINILAKRGKLTEEIKDRLEKAIPYGLSVNEVLKRRPDWAPTFGKKVEDVIRGMSPGEFAKNVQKEALKTNDVFRAMTIKQLRAIERLGHPEKMLAVGEVFYKHLPAWEVEIYENWEKGKRGDGNAKLKGDELARKKLIIENNDEFLGL